MYIRNLTSGRIELNFIMKTRLYIFLVLGILFMIIQLILIAFLVETKYPLINPKEGVAYDVGTFLVFFIWSAVGLPLLFIAYRLNKKVIRRKFETDNFLK